MEFEQFKNYLNLLGLAPGATLEQVKEAYKLSLQVFHPDKHPAGSASQKWASERLLVIKDAYEKLKEFYKENPAGELPGGWPGTGADPKSKGNAGEADGGSMDWQTWESEQQGSFAEEVKAWEERQKARQEVKLDEHGKIRRRKALTFTKFAVAGILACLWLGKCTNNQWENASRAQEAADWKARWEYQLETGGTASSAYGQDPQAIAAKAEEEAKRMTDRWGQQDLERNAGVVFLWVLTGGSAWLWFAARPKAVFANWVETGKLDTSELKAAAKDAAMQAKAKAEVAARKTVEAAEKLKVEAAKRMEEKTIEVPLEPPPASKASPEPAPAPELEPEAATTAATPAAKPKRSRKKKSDTN